MNVVGIIEEDFADSVDGIAYSIWFGGCDIRCPGCHNRTHWDLDPRNEYPVDLILQKTIASFQLSEARGIKKSLAILGGEPLAPFNRNDLYFFLLYFRKLKPEVKIRIWTGRTVEQIQKECKDAQVLVDIFNMADEVIVGPFIEKLKANLPLRGSSNQRILIKGKDYKVENEILTFLNNETESPL